ncbi:type 2A phosphatase-associated protein 42, putative [Plasmodium vinckei brucechwatti]|uniref:Type 2A phosphatase-associated protein 42, putative n=1 Tax=Plasmodium vinckei brucechwatti TaxID=119398 RepID=A0A6V7S133_PLAVN|nr:type 2A phosphatase-associated protein 42, putative [Plasmodium vinckei brucechwatti]
MEMNVVSSLFDDLYLLFDEYIVNHNKNINEYKSVFKKKELIELIKNYENGLVPTEKDAKNKDEIIDHLIYAFKLIGKYISSSDIFSKNEEVDDIHTKYLKFLLIPHILGSLCYETINIDIRFDRLKDAKLYFNEFITIVNIYNIVQINEYLYDDDDENCDRDIYKSSSGAHNAINRRNIKIKRVKDEKKYQQIYNELAKTNLKKRENLNFTLHDDDNDNNYQSNYDDEEYREMYLSIIKYKLIQTLNTIDLMDTEMLVLEMRNKEMTKKNDEKKNSEHGHNFPSLSNDNNKPTNYTKKPVIFKIKKNMQISDITQIRNYYKELVFKPFHNLPTISLEECAQIESQYALKGINNSENKNKKGKNKNVRNNELSDTDDDNEDDDYYKKCMEEEIEKDKNDREWDDWKYMHQKGIGNKNRNIM